jgi:hypothetical protein
VSLGRGKLKHVFFDKKTKKFIVFNKTKEDINFLWQKFCGESIISYDRGFNPNGNLDIELTLHYYHPDIFTEEQKRLYESRKDDDNPFLVKYNFKQ